MTTDPKPMSDTSLLVLHFARRWMSCTDIAAKMHVTPKTVRSSLNRLIERGLIDSQYSSVAILYKSTRRAKVIIRAGMNACRISVMLEQLTATSAKIQSERRAAYDPDTDPRNMMNKPPLHDFTPTHFDRMNSNPTWRPGQDDFKAIPSRGIG